MVASGPIRGPVQNSQRSLLPDNNNGQVVAQNQELHNDQKLLVYQKNSRCQPKFPRPVETPVLRVANRTNQQRNRSGPVSSSASAQSFIPRILCRLSCRSRDSSPFSRTVHAPSLLSTRRIRQNADPRRLRLILACLQLNGQPALFPPLLSRHLSKCGILVSSYSSILRLRGMRSLPIGCT